MKKRLFSILLALCMVLCLVPTTAFAESETEEPPVCSCETACTAEAMNADCPICGVEGALPENCAKCAQPADDAAVQPEGEVSDPQPEGEVSDPQPEGEVSDPQPEGEVSDPQPEGKVSDPQPKAALTALSGEGETPAASGAVTDVSTAADLTAAIANPDVNTVRLAANIDISNTLTVNRTVTLDLNGYALTVGGTELDIFSVDENGNLTVKDSGTGGKIDGQNKNCGFWIYGGVLTLESGTITNCTTDGDGGAVDISSGDSEGVYGKFVMNGGAITNCKVSDDSGAVDIGKGCTFIMNSGTISGCRADDDAGAIFIKGNASFVMNGGTIENCSAGFCGGAVKIRNTSSFTMTGGTISNCTAQQGGGVYVDDSSTFNMNGGSIASCTAVNGGNSVFVVKPSASFTMTGGTVDGSITMLYTVGNNTVYMDGLGTAAYPYQISTADQLKLFRDIVNGTGDQAQNRGAYAVLTADIDLNNEPWTPIGNYTGGNQIYYEGTFDGGGHTISGLNVTGEFVYAGLFGTVKDGTIKSLTVAGKVSPSNSQCIVGGIVGYADSSTIENCTNRCTVTGNWYAGGIVGWSTDSDIIGCANFGNISSPSFSGGICGKIGGENDAAGIDATIRDCYNVGMVSGNYAGGITGQSDSEDIDILIANCYNVGSLHGSTNTGEIIGDLSGPICTTIDNCYYLPTGNPASTSDRVNVKRTDSKTAAEFADGTVRKLLKAGERDNNADPWADECQYLAAADKTLPVFNGQGDAHDHQSNDWESNETEHWQACTCGAVFHKAQHSGGTATCTQRATCTVCGAEYGDALGHDFTTSWTHDDNMHWKQCSRCDAKDDVSPHTWDNGTITIAPTCTKAGERTYTCTECGATKTEPIDATGHSWKSDWTSDATHHWHECANESCDVTDNAGKNGYAEHSGGKATCTQNAVCEICKASYGSLDPNNHTDLKHIDAKAATAAEEGNIAYWYCDGCKKYFSDAAATKEITKAATVTAKLPPKITAGDGAAVTQGEKKELTFTSDASFADFLRVELDGTALEEKNYTKREGSTIITLNRDFVAALSVGEHTLAIVSQHGTATAKFTVKAKPTETATPQPTVTPRPTAQPTPTVQPVSPILRTGDTANPALWFALLIVSGGAAIGITVASRKKKHNK